MDNLFWAISPSLGSPRTKGERVDELQKVIQRRFRSVNQLLTEIPEYAVRSFQPWRPPIPAIGSKVDGMASEPVDGIPRNQWTACVGIGGRLGPVHAENIQVELVAEI
jgi:hypothetical protein